MKKFFSICILIIIILQELMIVSMANSLNLASTKYLILEEKLLITRIQPETPLEEFVNNFNIQSSNIHIYEDETFSNEVTEGYIKTGMYLTHDGANIKYELSVIGDIKQDGEMNQIDLNLLIKHVVGNKENQLDGIQKTSADINGDEKVNQIDITTLIRYIVTHELYIPEIKRPSSPDITITKGEKENEEWYKSDVELKISQNKNSDVEIGKTIYKIDSEEEKTVEGKEANITITKEGESKITAYAYSTQGARSETTSKTVKIDKQAPSAQIVLETTSNTMKVEVSAQDNLSGVKEYIYYLGTKNGDNVQWQQGINSKENNYTYTKLDASKEYYVKVEVFDNAGNKAIVEKSKETVSIPELYDDEKAKENDVTANITVKKEPTNWTNSNVIVKLQISEEISKYKLEYKKNTEEAWQKYNSETGIIAEENCEITVRLTDDKSSGKGISIKITNIDKEKAQVKVSNVGVTSKSFTQKIEVTDNASGLSKIALYYRKVGETQYKVKEENYQTINGSEAGELTTSKTITIDNLTNGSYEIYTEVTDVAGNVTTVKGFEGQGGPAGDDGKGNEGEPGASKPIEEITSAEGTVTLTPDNTNWTNGSVKVTATTSNSTYQIQTSIDASNWSTNTTITMNENGTIYARLYDGINSGDVISLTIGNIDKQNPSSSISASNTYSITSGTTTSISATVTHTDNESGVNIGNCKYVFNTSATKLGNVTSNYTGGTFSSNGQTISKTVSAGTYYLHVLTVDNAGNAIETIYGPITVTQKVTGISLNKTSAELEIDETLQLTATVTPSAAGNKELTWSSSNTSVATVDQNGLVIAVAEGSATITATAKDGSGKSANCSVTVNNPNISTTESYVKYYADVNNDGYPEGVIFADMVADGGKTGIWNLYGDSILSSCGTYTISTVSSSSAKSYKIVKEKYNGKFGTAPVIQACSESGEDRFYVMNLYELLATKYNWYYSAYEEKISDYSTVTSEDFGTGKKNTETMIEKWNNQVYGSQNGNTSYKDIWGNIEKEFNNEDSWFLPSRAELAAFGDTFNVNSYNYKNTYGLSDCYFTSSLKDNERIWVAFCSGGAIGVANVNNEHRVRLCATF